ncbi:hypothetical protein TNCV_2650721 [Trichonephila clavipes]|nr:hypothetical protein TNCV_2650721 [Trichonephila clavipes]
MQSIHPETVTRRKGLIPDETANLLQELSGNESNGGELSCSNLDSYEDIRLNNMLTKYQMIKFIDFCEVWFLPESVARVAAIVGDHRCHTPRS